jgi:hypothetical protein
MGISALGHPIGSRLTVEMAKRAPRRVLLAARYPSNLRRKSAFSIEFEIDTHQDDKVT